VSRAKEPNDRKVGKRPVERDAASFESLDRLFHERARLAILTSVLRRPEGVPFVELKDHCQLTDGNLSRHLQALRDAGILDLWKRSSTGRPRTICVITPRGRERFLAYLDALEGVVREALAASRSPRQRAPRRLEGGFGGLAPA
jgi:DNA-binding transcriptional ArsR family regulator